MQSDGASLFQFFHGLAFFALGMAIPFINPRASRLEVGRRLPLLAVFAFCEAVTAWSDILLPPPPAIISFLLIAIQGVGYSALLGFGLLASPYPARTHPYRSRVPLILLGLWLLSILAAILASMPDTQITYWAEIVARYGLAMPGGLLALLSMRSYTYRSIDPEVLKLIKGSRRITGVALGTFGLLAGLVSPTTTLLCQIDKLAPLAQTLLPAIPLLLALCGVTITYGLTRTLNVVQWEMERWIEGVEQSQALAADRERIGRELHDGIIQSIYAAGLMLESVRHTIPQNPTSAQEQLSQVMVSLNKTIQDIRRYIFDLRGGTPETSLVGGLETLLRDFRVNTLLETRLRVIGDETYPLGMERRRHILQIAREALSNVARHARARRVEIRLTYRSDNLQLQVADDGVGLTVIPTNTGQGLRNIRERATLLGGTLDIDSTLGQGVTITLTVPYQKGENL